jgi:DNA-binding CsgD family transcriptional regulator
MYVDLRKNFGVGDGITVIEVFEDCTEFFHFGAQEDTSLMNLYLNNLNILRKFIYYFKDKMNEVIEAMSDTRILLPMKARFNNEEQEMLQAMLAVFNSLTEVNRYYGVGVQSNIYLTKREMECFYWYFMGKTADEIGLILKLSKRTVETYLLNAKIKTNCYNKRQLNYKHFDSLFMAGS